MGTDELIIVVAFHKITLLLCLKLFVQKYVEYSCGRRENFISVKCSTLFSLDVYVGCQGQWNLCCV